MDMRRVQPVQCRQRACFSVCRFPNGSKNIFEVIHVQYCETEDFASKGKILSDIVAYFYFERQVSALASELKKLEAAFNI